MKTIAAAVAIAVSLLVALSGPAKADLAPVNEGGDYRHCVTYDEFNAFYIGMPQNRVQRIFDTNGRRESQGTLNGALGAVGGPSVGEHSTVRSYPACDDDDRVLVEFGPRGRARSGSYGI